jgi:hypothetical protein
MILMRHIATKERPAQKRQLMFSYTHYFAPLKLKLNTKATPSPRDHPQRQADHQAGWACQGASSSSLPYQL